MAYSTGSAVSFAAVKTALVDACVADGWTNTADAGSNVVLSKSGVFVQVVDAVDSLAFRGRTSLDAGDAPNAVTMGDAIVNLGDSDIVSFPLTYHVFTFTNEVFLVIGYGDRYQWASFGLSTQVGLTGSGAFVGASFSSDRGTNYGVLSMTSSTGGTYPNQPSGALFWSTYAYNIQARNSFIHTNIDTANPWILGLTSTSTNLTGIKYLTQLIDTQPNTFNSESVLMPIRAYKERTSSKTSQVAEVENARHIRVDNYNNEQIITLGLDKWMVFPWYAKNVAVRNGGVSLQHSGTFGWAIKYEGP
jgi:hypothetical protein